MRVLHEETELRNRDTSPQLDGEGASSQTRQAFRQRAEDLKSGGMAGGRKRSSMALAKLRFLSVVRAKFRTEVLTVRRAPNLNVTIAKQERLVAERATQEIASLEVLAARDHRIAPSNHGQLEHFVPRRI